jgi:hypothetical protein
VLEGVGCTDAGWGSWTADDRIVVSGDCKRDLPGLQEGTRSCSGIGNHQRSLGFFQQGWHLSGCMEAGERGRGGEGLGATPSTGVCGAARGGRIIFGHYWAINTVQARI